MLTVDRGELRKVPYIDNIPLDGRIVFLQPYLDKKDSIFKTFVPKGNKLTWIFAEPVEACYYADACMDMHECKKLLCMHAEFCSLASPQIFMGQEEAAYICCCSATVTYT